MYSDFNQEIGEAKVEQERQAKVDAIRIALRRSGTTACIDCGCTISSARKRVHPSATRCLECQESAEKEAYLR